MNIDTLYRQTRALQVRLDSTDVFDGHAMAYIWGDGLSAIRIEMDYRVAPEYGSKRETFVRKLDHDQLEIMTDSDVSDWIAETIIEANSWIDNIPSLDQRAHDAFTASLGRLIDQGRDIGIEVDFLNPLTAMMQKLATNALEDKRGQ